MAPKDSVPLRARYKVNDRKYLFGWVWGSAFLPEKGEPFQVADERRVSLHG